MTDNNKYDALGDFFRQRFENHQLSIDDDCWTEIEQRLNNRKKKKSLIWMWSSGMATAAAVALLLIISSVTSEEGVLEIFSTEVQRTQGFTEISVESIENPSLACGEDKDENLIAKNAKFLQKAQEDVLDSEFQVSKEAEGQKGGKQKAESGKQKAEGTVLDSEFQVSKEEKNEISENTLNSQFSTLNSQLSTLNSQLSPDSVTQDEIDKFIYSLNEDIYNKGIKSEKKSKWLLAAGFGTGSYIDNSDKFSSKDYVYENSNIVESGLRGNNLYAVSKSNSIKSFDELSMEKFTEISHAPPLSFGLTVSKTLGKNFGVESGLVYTFLASKVKWTDEIDYSVSQRLHYIGIPVNLTVYLWNVKPSVRIYISGGGMVEKGIQAIYNQKRKSQYFSFDTDVKSSKIDGFQWSINGAIGINYRIINDFGIYFEPQVGYCFDNNQPVSLRTEWPLYVGVRIGVNYELGIRN